MTDLDFSYSSQPKLVQTSKTKLTNIAREVSLMPLSDELLDSILRQKRVSEMTEDEIDSLVAKAVSSNIRMDGQESSPTRILEILKSEKQS